MGQIRLGGKNYSNTNMGYKPKPDLPEFIVEYELMNSTNSSDTFTVVNPGLYLIIATGTNGGGVSITINSKGQIWSHNAQTYSYSEYYIASLNSDDTITYSKTYTQRASTYHAIRIKNATYDSLITYEGKREYQVFSYNIENIEKPALFYFSHAATGSISDTSNISEVYCNTYAKQEGYTGARIVACKPTDNGGTVNMTQYDYPNVVTFGIYLSL